MTSQRQTITGELRKWRLQQLKGLQTGVVVGYMYNDVNDIWEDGDEAVIHFVFWHETANFYLAGTNTSCIKLEKSEERVDRNGVDPSK